jgi:D-alanine-D-alanine ligase
MKKMRLALLSGGKSSEREVSLKSGAQVLQALDKDKYDIMPFDPKFDLEKLIRQAPEIDVALIIMHGRWGEDGTIQGLLDLLEIPYQGSGVLASAMAINKEISKMAYQRAGLQVAQDRVFSKTAAPAVGEIIQQLGMPVVIKPVTEGSSIGITIARTEAELAAGIALAWQYDQRVLVEQFIAGIEVTGGVLGNADLQALPLIEIVPSSKFPFFNYEAKYQPGATTEICPARISPELTRKVQETVLTAHRALGCRGYSRTDTMIKDGEVFVLETNTIPGMTATSLFPQAAAHMGMSFPALLDTLIQLALEKSNQ